MFYRPLLRDGLTDTDRNVQMRAAQFPEYLLVSAARSSLLKPLSLTLMRANPDVKLL